MILVVGGDGKTRRAAFCNVCNRDVSQFFVIYFILSHFLVYKLYAGSVNEFLTKQELLEKVLFIGIM